MADPWERQPDPRTGKDESDTAYEAFCLYRDLPPRERSIARVHAALKARDAGRKLEPFADPETGRRVKRKRLRSGAIEGWCNCWNWVLRARAWDNERDRVRRQAQLDEEIAVGKRHAQNCDAWLRLAQQPMITILQKLQADPALDIGSKENVQLMKLAAMFMRTVPRMQVAERLARGMPLTVDPAGKAATESVSDDSLPIEGTEFTWGEINCACGHPHSRHDQTQPDPTLVPCTVEGCKCQKFKRPED